MEDGGVPGKAGNRVPGLVLGPRQSVLGRPVGARSGALEDDGKMGAGGFLGCRGWEEGWGPRQKIGTCGGSSSFPKNVFLHGVRCGTD